MNITRSKSFGFGLVAALFLLVFGMVNTALGTITVNLQDIDSGLTSPTGTYRWLDVANQAYSVTYQTNYNYTQATVQVQYDIVSQGLAGTLLADNLKPNFAYQVKLTGFSGTPTNEAIGLAGRWWREEWNGTEWINGQNSNDSDYLLHKDDPLYKYTGYLLFDYFITDANGDATLDFVTDSSYHVLWKTDQRVSTANDGPVKPTTFDADDSTAYEDTGGNDFAEQAVSIYGEVERPPVGGVYPDLDSDLLAQLILTEESFHGSGGDLAGNWAGAMGATLSAVPEPGTVLLLGVGLVGFVGVGIKRRRNKTRASA